MSNPKPSKSFKKGVSGNPKGRPKKGTSLTELLREKLSQLDDNGVSAKDKIVQQVLDKAMEGDKDFVKFAWSYIDGMPKQSLDVTARTWAEALLIEEKKLIEDKEDEQ